MLTPNSSRRRLEYLPPARHETLPPHSYGGVHQLALVGRRAQPLQPSMDHATPRPPPLGRRSTLSGALRSKPLSQGAAASRTSLRWSRFANGMTIAAGTRASQKLKSRYATTPAAAGANGTWNQVSTQASRISTMPGPPNGSDRRVSAHPVP